MYPRNAASPPRVAIGPVVQISDGAVQTSGVSVKVKPEGTTASAGGGTISYEEGIVAYVPTQAETDYTAFQVIAYKTGCIPAAVTVVTSASATAGKVVLSGETHTAAVVPTVSTVTNAVTLPASASINITGNITGNLSGSVGSVTGNVGGNVSGSVGSISGVTFPSNFATLGINASGHITRVVLCDTITTYTGDTPQTGDSFARIGANGSGLTSLAPAATALSTATWTGTRAGYLDNLSGGAVALQSTLLTVAGYIDTEIGTIASGVSDIQSKIGTPVDLGGGFPVTLAGMSSHLNSVLDTVAVVTDSIALNGSGLSAIPWNAAWDAEVQSEVADALGVYDPPTNAEMEARTLAAASYATASALSTVAANVSLVLADTGTDGVVLSGATCNKIADHVRRRTQANVEASSDGDALSLLSLYGVIQQIQESNAAGSTLTVYRTDGTTSLGTRTLATDAAADPVTGVS